FKKVDSLFRGPWAAELAACFELGAWRHCIVAPAFPHHGRHTRDGRQVLYAGNNNWRDVSGDIAARLTAEGLPTVKATSPRHVIAEGVTVFDAHTDQDLDDIVEWVLQTVDSPVLWCGTGGLAQALARRRDLGPTPQHWHAVPLSRKLAGPVLGLFGSDQPITLAQVQACAPYWATIADGGDAPVVRERLLRDGAAMVNVALPEGLDRDDAARRINLALGTVAKALPPPGTLIVAGGETLRGLCSALDVTALRLTGQIAPGLPRSTIVGGPWEGVTVISKSGAFGGPALWRDLLSENALIVGGEEP
ncbi:MAG: hypothetical protein KGI75_16855, partial [Rhizobiaceae bacterium]|nr:hypothetical protein [Rhizobiaceae bacterium]